jgi:zinc protease
VPEPLVAKRPDAMPFETPDKANAFLTGSTSFALTDRDPDYPAFLLANYLLGGSTDSRLWNRVRQKEGLSYSVGSSFRASSFEPNSALNVSAIFAPQNLERLRAAVADEVNLVVTEGFSAAEVESGKRALLQERKLSRTQDAGLAEALTQQEYLGRNFAFSGEVDAAIARLTPEAVNAAARKYLKPDSFAFVYAGDFAKAAGSKVGAK